MASEPYTLDDLERDARICVFLAWLATEKNVELCELNADEWQPIFVTGLYSELAKEFTEWQKSHYSF